MKTLVSIASFFIFTQFYGQKDDLWQKIPQSQSKVSKKISEKTVQEKYDLYELNSDLLKSRLEKARSIGVNKPIPISFPGAGGEIESYLVYENSILATDLQKKYSNIKNYVGVNIQNVSETIQFTTTLFGLHAFKFSNNDNDTFIEPLEINSSEYKVYRKADGSVDKKVNCLVKNTTSSKRQSNKATAARAIGDGNFRKFRLALSCTVEYSNFHIRRAAVTNGSEAQKKEAVLAAMAVTIARVNSIYERDLGIKLELVSNNDQLISINNDTFSNTDADKLLDENQTFIDSRIGNNNYDVGHIFATGSSGLAREGCVCSSGIKAQGTTGILEPVGDIFDVDFVAHEIGHQFGASHTFNGNTQGGNIGTCDSSNFSGDTAVETGSGSTIMGYAGICNDIDVQENSDPYFSFISVDQITNYVIDSGTCSLNVQNNNPKPNITGIQNYTIPKSTPFVLDATVSNTNTGSYTYCWEQNDVQESIQPPVSTSVFGPLFRSTIPSQNSFRYFPALSTVVANSIQNKWEVIPSVARSMKFVITVRDNGVVNGGLTTNAELQVNVANVGPFVVTSPNTNVSWEIGTNQTVTWDVAGTDANGINTSGVDIYLSTDGGLTFPEVLAMNVPNDGSEEINVPDFIGTQNRIMVKAHNSIFYDVNNANCTIIETTTPSFRLKTDNQTVAQCDGAETKNVTYRILYSTIAGFTGTTILSASGNPLGSVVTFSKNNLTQNDYVDLTVSNISPTILTGTYQIIVTGTSGTLTKKLNLYLEIYSSIFPKVKLLSPTNFQETPPTDLLLTWENNVNIPLYDIQIATDEGFTNIIELATVPANSYKATKLENGAIYFWRVQPKNKGCAGQFSDIFQFKTVFCKPFNLRNDNLFFENKVVFGEINIEREKGIIIDAINADINIQDASIEFITARIISPIGTKVILFEDQCIDGDVVSATFSDNGIPIVCGATLATEEFVKPKDAFSKIYGESSRGTWRLELDYKGKGELPEIRSWTLNFCSNQEVGVEEKTNSLVLYPNPSNGSFNVELENVLSKKVTVFVFDTTGRRIFATTYNSDSYFNQNIQLSLTSGIYFVTLVDGNREDTKKLIIR
jgi:Metallo-peptidase family M12B Reprolysin-like/Secretion system C-terminal sorting domain/Proprotein convertase P-domain